MTPDDDAVPTENDPATESSDVSEAEIESVPVDSEPLERSEDAIDEAREAVAKAVAIDAIDPPGDE